MWPSPKFVTDRRQNIPPLSLFVAVGGTCCRVGLASGHYRRDYEHLGHHLLRFHRGGGLRKQWGKGGFRTKTMGKWPNVWAQSCFCVGRGCRDPTWRLSGRPQASFRFVSGIMGIQTCRLIRGRLMDGV